jgi:uncharacterized protein (DUF1800 family)
MSVDPNLKAAIAVTRFGLGARPGEIQAARANPTGFLKAQIRPEGADQPVGDLLSAPQAVLALGEYQAMRKAEKAAAAANLDPNAKPLKAAGVLIHDTAGADFLARAQLAATTDAGFRERWALFWANHFTVAASKLGEVPLVGPFEREAIRPHVFGRFEDLLVASTSHPGMLAYLDQAQSFGPDSVLAQRRHAAGLNENLAREVLELHTLGVGSGYSQADVTEFARALTGWSYGGPNEADRPRGPTAPPPPAPGEFTFRVFAHQPGARVILGKTYAEGGHDQGRAVLHDLAAHPATAHHIAVKLARHFVADDPPPALVARLERSFKASGGRLDRVAATLIDAPESWVPAADKFKTPYEFLVSGYRATGTAPTALPQIAPILNAMGQKAFDAPSPKGWSDEAQSWAAPDALMKRIGWSEGFAAAVPPTADQPMQLAQNALGARLSPAVATAIARAETRNEALSILLMSPEFQRR